MSLSDMPGCEPKGAVVMHCCLLAVVLTERDKKIRVITSYDLDAGQKRDYLERRAGGE